MSDSSPLEEELNWVENELKKVDFMFHETENKKELSLAFLIRYNKRSYTSEETGIVYCIMPSIMRYAPDINNEKGTFELGFPYWFTKAGFKNAKEDIRKHAKRLYNLQSSLPPKTGAFPRIGTVKYNYLYRSVLEEQLNEVMKKASNG